MSQKSEISGKSGAGRNGDLSVMLKEAGILFAITLIAGLLLGVVYELTKEPRRLRQQEAIEEACVAVFPRARAQKLSLTFEEIEYAPSPELLAELEENGVELGTVYRAENAGVFYGYVLESTSSKGYGGDIVLYVGVEADGTVGGVSILEIKETAGLGMEAPNVLAPQFEGRKVDSFVYTRTGAQPDSNQVDAISSATITTKAVTDAVNGGLKAGLELLEGGAEHE